MKKYLVSYNTGAKVGSCIVQTPDDYIPDSDDCKLLKELVVKAKEPKKTEYYNFNRWINIYTYDNHKIPVEKLQLIAVSNLGL